MDLDPGWRPDPTKLHGERYWDGISWSDRVRDGDEETTSDFDNAQQIRPTGIPKPASLSERRATKWLIIASVVGGLIWLVAPIVLGALDGLPPTAKSGAGHSQDMYAMVSDVSEAASDGRWTVVAEYFSDALFDRGAIADTLRSCLSEVVVGSSARDIPAGDTISFPDSPVTVAVAFDPRADQLIDVIRLEWPLVYEGDRWTLTDGVRFMTGDDDWSTCPSA